MMLQVVVVLAAFICIVVSQDPSLFNNLQNSAPPAGAGTMDFSSMGTGGFPQSNGGFPPSGLSPNFGTMPAPLSRPNPMSAMYPLMLARGSDMAQMMAMMHMFGGGHGGMGGAMGQNPFLMYTLMNSF
ncbi:hypothetical protein Btru_004191 [Bulinus truncatus]|nr:hypothetical protein Btru_004191 [Bulinus truncatus]